VTFLFIAFLAVPILEIAAFIQVGSLIGLWPTLALTVATASAGAVMVRYQGFRTLNALKENLDSGQLPLEPVIHAGFLLIAGLCLLTPGFITDTIGFILLIPAARLAVARALWRYVKRHGDVTIVTSETFQSGRTSRDRGPTIDLEAEDVSDERSSRGDETHSSSPWLKNDGPTR